MIHPNLLHKKLTRFMGASAVSDGYSKTWHMRFMIAGNGHFSEAKSANIQFLGCIFPLTNDFVKNSGCSPIYNHPAAWWKTPEVQNAKNNFCEQYTRSSPNWIREWKEKLLEIAAANNREE